MCLHMWAHWRHLANTIELVLPSAHPSPQSKRQINRFGRSCTDHDRKSLYLQWALLSPKIAPSDGVPGPPSNTWFPGPTRFLDPNGISVGSAIFALTTAECLYTLQWDAPSAPSKLPLLIGDLDPPSNTWFPGTTREPCINS